MQRRFDREARNLLLAGFVILGLAAALFLLPHQFASKASSKKGLLVRTTTADEAIPNYDIRFDAQTGKTDDARNAIDNFRSAAGKGSSAVDAIRNGFVAGESNLRSRVPTLKVEYNQDIRTPEVIGTDLWKGRHFLTSARSTPENKHAGVLIDFLKENDNLIGATQSQIEQLKVAADYTNPNGILSFVELNQEINGIPVFRGEIKAGFTKDGQMIRVINNFAAGIDYDSVSTEFGDPVAAVRVAASSIKQDLRAEDITPNAASTTDKVAVFGDGGDDAIRAEKMYFPTEPGVIRPAWRVLIMQPVTGYYVIVDGATGTLLWRKNIGNDQTQSATYNVYSLSSTIGGAMHSPAPLIPGPTDPTLHTQAPLGTRTNVTLIGNEGALSFNNLGWITDGTNGSNGWTDGNNVEAGLDVVSPNGVDAPLPGTNRVFSFNYTPSNVTGGVEGGDSPTTTAAASGAVTNLFYLTNRYHDALYQVGFTEPARNFQNDNFGRGGAGADRVSAEAHDSSGTNNANFATPADGGRGRMQMYLFTNGSAPGRDGSLDADVVFHELTHGTSNRLIGNANGLNTNRSGGSGEGWGDLYGTMLSLKPTDTINDILTTGGYVTYKCCGLTTYVDNYYYGIRRLPYARIGLTGGPSNKAYNPFTLNDLNTVTVADAAYPCSTLITCPGSASEVHNEGEIWAVTGIEVWAQIAGHGGGTVPAAQKVLQTYTDGMKLSPLNPTFIQSRDAVIAAAAALPLSPENSQLVGDVREGFRLRGMGFSATDNGTTAAEAFDTANVRVDGPMTVNDSPGNGNGVPEPGENVLLGISVINPNTGGPISNVQVSVNGGTPVSYGTIGDGNTVSHEIPYSISAAAPCGSTVTVTITVTSDAGAQTPETRSFTLGSPVGIAESFDGVSAPNLPSGWTTTQDAGTGITWATTTAGPDTAPNSAFANDPAGVNMSSLVSPVVAVTSPSAQIKFRNKYITESTFDGAVLEIKIGAGAWQDFIAAGGSWVSGGYNATISTSFQSPIAGRSAWSGTSVGGYIDTVGTLPAAANGQSVQFRWRMASDSSVASTGINIDGVQIVSSYNCAAPPSGSARADFDGDGKTDVSVFRPSTGDWYALRSTTGFEAIHWGATGDVVVPGDYDGDGKADFAVWRPSDTPFVTDFYVLYNDTFTFSGFSHGLTTDIPVPGDFDGDGKSDIVVWRPSTGTFWIYGTQGQTTTSAQFGSPGDIPMGIDKDGDGKANLAVYRPSDHTFYIANATGTPAQNFTSVQWGSDGDKLVPADYDGDGKEDVAVFRPSNGVWYIYTASGNTIFTQFGASGDVPVPGDYDGDGKTDVAVYRGGTWYLNQSTAGFAAVSFGLAADQPVPSKYVPTVSGGGGGGGAVDVAYSGPAVPITDNTPAGVNATVDVSGVGNISDLNFSFDGTASDPSPTSTTVGLTHSWVGDLIVKLTSPMGTTVTLVDRPGVPASTFGCNNNNFYQMLLNDEGSLPPVENGCNTPGGTGAIFPSGPYSPQNPLSAFDGENADGTWTLNVSDNGSGDTGTLRAFSLHFNSGN